MSFQTYSRDYLQAIPQQRKEQIVDTIIQGFIQDIHTAAAVGGTSYRYIRSLLSFPEVTDAEIVAGFFARFPGCKIYYEDVWVDVGNDTKKRKKGIVIDWS
jgi:hypothetical protein